MSSKPWSCPTPPATCRYRRWRIAGMTLLASTTAGQAAPTGLPDPIFANGFQQAILRPFQDILLRPFATEQASCPASGPTTLNVRPGTPVLLCYGLENRSSVVLDNHELVDGVFGLVHQGNQPIPPGQTLVVADAGGPRTFERSTWLFTRWRTAGGGLVGEENRALKVNVAPALALYRFVETDPARCPPGVLPFFPAPLASGHTRLTVAPGTPVHHCFRARNESVSTMGASILNGHQLIDSGLAPVVDPGQPLANHELYTVSASQSAAVDAAFTAHWSASDGTQTVSGSATSSLVVVGQPACAGIRQGTSYDYVSILGTFVTRANIRLDFEIDAAPVRAGQAFSVVAGGAITALLPDTYGPRLDTRVVVQIPTGVDLAQPFHAQASIDGGVPIQASVDVATRRLVLSTGPVSGPPASIQVSLTAHADAGTAAIDWQAPRLEQDFAQANGNVNTVVIHPDPGGPPMLHTPRCPVP
ncbi:MAG: hypothetical protein KF823_01745 [Xanthomonadales bacterium]|nr:hypothetical protein [Xanthomonadales bacterium]